MSERILLIGPCPPPDAGTTIPFRIFCEYAQINFGISHRIRVVNSNTGEKAGLANFRPGTLLKLTGVLFQILGRAFWAQKVVVFGSQRFITYVGSALVLFFKPLGKRIYLRINGGAYDLFYSSAPVITRTLIEKCMQRADSIVVETDLVFRAMNRAWPRILHVAPNYRSLPTSGMDARTSPSSHIRFIYTGSVRKLKGCDDLLAAYLMLRGRLAETGNAIETTLRIVGPIHVSDGVDTAAYRDHPDIQFKGAMSNDALRQEYTQADVFVFPTRWPTEGHSGSVVEAMMYGMPIVSSNWRAMPEIVIDNVNGLLYETGDIPALAEQLYRLCTDIELRARLAAGARANSARFDAETVCAQLAESFQLRVPSTPAGEPHGAPDHPGEQPYA